ncbi:terpene synthase family protein [Kribbella endophytica]
MSNVSYLMPELRLPFATASHPQAHVVQQLTEEWCRRFGLLRSPEVVAKFRALGHGRIMATLCPSVPLHGLSLVTDWNAFFFITADQQNIAITSGRYEELVASMRRVIADDTVLTAYDDHALVVALRDLLHRTIPGRPTYWVTRLRRNLDRWLTGHLVADAYRVSGIVPTVDDYMAVRRDASTVLPTLDLVELVEVATIPEALYRTPEYQTLVLGTADLMCWINDIHSPHREQGDPINFVNVLQHHEGLGVQEAVDAVTTRIAVRVDQYLTAAKELPSTMDGLGIAPQSQLAVLRCVEDQQSWAAGGIAGGAFVERA